MILKDQSNEKEKGRETFIKLSIVHYAINLINIVLVIQLLFYDNIGYSIAYMVIFCFEKLIGLLILYDGWGQRTKLWICDFLQVGFVYLIYNKNTILDYDSTQTLLLGIRIFPILLTQLIYFFGCGFLQQNSEINYIVILSYLIFIAQFIFGVFIISNLIPKEFQKQKKNIFYSCLVTLSCYYFMLGSLSQFEDTNGNNLGYYALAIGFINYLIYLFFTPPIENLQTFLGESLFYIFSCCFTNSTLNYEYIKAHQLSSAIQTSTVINYYTASIKIGILITFSYETIWKLFSEIQNQSVNQFIVGFNVVLSIILNLIFIIVFYQRVLNQIRSVKKIIIKNTNHFSKAKKIMQANHKYLKVYYVCIFLKQKTKIESINKQLMLEDFCSLQCKKLFEFYKDCSECQKKQILFYFSNFKFQECECYIMRVAKEIEQIHYQQALQITHHMYLSSDKVSKLYHILLQRYMNGFMNTSFTQDLQIIQFNPSCLEVIKQINKLQSTFLSVIAFLKYFSEDMSYFPSRILYDLQE